MKYACERCEKIILLDTDKIEINVKNKTEFVLCENCYNDFLKFFQVKSEEEKARLNTEEWEEEPRQRFGPGGPGFEITGLGFCTKCRALIRKNVWDNCRDKKFCPNCGREVIKIKEQ